MSVCAAAPSPCLPPEKSANFVLKFRLIAETSNSRNVHPVSVTFRRFVYSATCRNDGKAFRRQRFSPFRLHVVIGSGRLCGATRDSADRRPTLTAESPKSEKTGENRRIAEKWENRRKSPNRRIAEKWENRRKSPFRRKDRDAWKMF